MRRRAGPLNGISANWVSPSSHKNTTTISRGNKGQPGKAGKPG